MELFVILYLCLFVKTSTLEVDNLEIIRSAVLYNYIARTDNVLDKKEGNTWKMIKKMLIDGCFIKYVFYDLIYIFIEFILKQTPEGFFWSSAAFSVRSLALLFLGISWVRDYRNAYTRSLPSRLFDLD